MISAPPSLPSPPRPRTEHCGGCRCSLSYALRFWGRLLGWPRTFVAAPLPVATAQDFPTDDPIIKAIWNQGMEHSELYELAQTLFDSIGPRLTGTPEQAAAVDWAVAKLLTYQAWEDARETSERFR